MSRKLKAEPTRSTNVRCAIYTRKSTEEGLNQEFNSLNAQRESAEAYIKSQSHEGWVAVTEKYDDGGFTGGNMERPGLQRLLRDIEAKKIDAVIVYKVDRLSRSLLDFSRLIDTFDQHGIAFVSVTQQFNTASSMGRLVLNVLLSFAQFEREIISERTRDKIAATKRKGKWAGGWPVLGYDVDPQTRKLTPNVTEANHVQAIFELYLEHGSLIPVVEELNRRCWTNKQWQTKSGTTQGGHDFTKNNLHNLLTNPVYIGKVKYKTEVHEGEHSAIIDRNLWQRVQTQLARNGRTGGAATRNRYGALLKGMLRCSACDAAMCPSHTKKGNKVYRYYVCSSATKRGWKSCPAKSIPANEIEQLVVNQIRTIATDPKLQEQVLQQLREQEAAQRGHLETEQKSLERELAKWHTELRVLSQRVQPGELNDPLFARIAELHERISSAETRQKELARQLESLVQSNLAEADVLEALSQFGPVWESLTTREQERVLRLAIAQIDYDGNRGKIAIQFRSTQPQER
jgi:site-specific DNA recombinase